MRTFLLLRFTAVLLLGAGATAQEAHEKVPPLSEVQLQARSQYGLGAKEHRRGNWSKAVELADRALELDPHFGKAAELKGWSHLQLGEHAAATLSLQHALDLNPNRVSLVRALAMLHRVQGDHDLALQKLERLEKLEGKSFSSMEERGRNLAALHRYDDALRVYRELKARDPRNLASRGLLMELLVQMGQIDAALAESRELVRLDPSSLPLGIRLATLLVESGDHAGAAQWLEEMTGKFPTNEWVCRMLMQLYAGPLADPERFKIHESRLKEAQGSGR